MSSDSIVRLVAHAAVNARDWQTFEQMVAATKLIVAQEGAQVLIHECYYNPQTYQCLIQEAYVSEAAFLHHLELIKPLSAQYKIDWKIELLELIGPYSPALLEAMKQGSPGTQVLHYEHVLNN